MNSDDESEISSLRGSAYHLKGIVIQIAKLVQRNQRVESTVGAVARVVADVTRLQALLNVQAKVNRELSEKVAAIAQPPALRIANEIERQRKAHDA